MNYKSIFDENVKRYYNMSDPNIKKAYIHSIRTMEFSRDISSYLGLNLNEVKFAEFIGLIHDLGRFEQIKFYNIFDDMDIIEHSSFGLDLLFGKNEINQYNIDPNMYSMIANIIKYYNKDDNNILKGDELLFSMILKDASSLDFLNSIEMNNIIRNQSISKNIEQDFFNKKIINSVKACNEKEELVKKLSLVFGLNFKYSFNYLCENDVINKIKETLEEDKEFEDYINFMELFINERMEKHVR